MSSFLDIRSTKKNGKKRKKTGSPLFDEIIVCIHHPYHAIRVITFIPKSDDYCSEKRSVQQKKRKKRKKRNVQPRDKSAAMDGLGSER